MIRFGKEAEFEDGSTLYLWQDIWTAGMLERYMPDGDTPEHDIARSILVAGALVMQAIENHNERMGDLKAEVHELNEILHESL